MYLARYATHEVEQHRTQLLHQILVISLLHTKGCYYCFYANREIKLMKAGFINIIIILGDKSHCLPAWDVSCNQFSGLCWGDCVDSG